MKNIGLILIVLFVIGISAFYYGKSKAETKIEYKTIEVIKEKIDTVKVEITKVEKEVEKKQKQRKQLQKKEQDIVYPIEDCKEIVDNLKEQLENCDTIVQLKDTIIYKELEVIKYKDKIIEKMVLPKKKPFGIGFQLGYGTNGKEFMPYIGFGVSYNIANF